jgi:PAS domain S-box-containing protein
VDRFIRSCGYSFEAMTLLKDLSRSEQLLVDILKSLFHGPALLILDEVFERLSAIDLEKIIRQLQQMKSRGMSIILITHRIDDIYEYADRVSVMKNGEVLLSTGVGNINKMNLITLTYTQITQEEHLKDIGREFYQYLKYNEAILQSLPVILLVVDGENLIKVANQSARDFFGADSRHLINRPVQELFAPAAGHTARRIQRALEGRQKKVFYSLPLELNGRHTVDNLIIYPIEDGTLIIGRIIIIEDLTEHEKLRDQLILSEKLASVGLLAAGVAHEINNPLGIITNYLQSIRFTHPQTDLTAKLRRIEDQIKYIATIVSNLLTFSDSNRLAMEELEQVVLNLLKNSFEAMPAGGTVSISAEHGQDKDGDFLLLQVQDNGPGISHENLSDIFLPFSSSKKNGQGNLGLGLYVSYGIIKKYHGQIGVENLASGCRFTIRLPRAARTH